MTWLLSFLSFIQPWALYGVVAIAVPVIIHLLSKSRGRLVQWGTTRFLPQSTPIKMTKLKLTQRLLLLLRCLIILCSVAIFAQLFFTNDKGNDNTIVLVSTPWFESANEQQREQINQYMRLSDHQVLSLESLEIIESLTSFDNANKANYLNIWRQLSVASEQFKQAKQFLVFTNAKFLQFAGEKPLISQPIQWFITSENNPLSVNSLVHKPFNLIIYADDGHQNALNYLLPALNVIKQFNVEKLSILVIEQQQDIMLAERPDWVFYLTNKPVMKKLTKWQAQGTHLFIDGNNSPLVSKTRQTTVNSGHGLLNPIRVYPSSQLINSDHAQESEEQRFLWLSENQTPILTVTENENENENENKSGKRCRFASVFSPQYTNLVLQPQFPLVLQTLLFGELIAYQQQANDQISVENINQLTSLLYEQGLAHQGFISNASGNVNYANTKVDFDNHQRLLLWLGLVLVILFLLERLISEYLIPTPLVVSRHE